MELSLARPAMSLVASGEKFGPRMHPHLSAFRNCVQLASELTESRGDPGPLESQIGLLDDALDALPTSDVLYHHITALCNAAAAFGCVSAENPSEHLSIVVDDTAPSIHALQQMNDSSHSQFAHSISALFEELRVWVTHNLKIGGTTGATASVSMPLPKSTASSSNVNTSASVDPTHTAPHLIDYKHKISEGAARIFKSAADAVGGRASEIASPAKEAFDEIYYFLVEASELSRPPSDDQKQKMIRKIVDHMKIVSNLSSACPPRDFMFNHVKAVEEAMGMVSWIVAAKKPVTFITDADGASSFYLNKILTATKKAPNASSHKTFVDALKNVFSIMREYVKEYYAVGMRYGIGVHGAQTTSPAMSPVYPTTADSTEANYMSAFKALIDGPLTAYVDASKPLSGEVLEQALLFEAVWQAESEFLAKAFTTPKPSADDVQSLLVPIAEKMGSVSAVVDKLDPRGPFAQHCNAVSESVGALGWVAVEEKATTFVGDMASAGQFFIDKVKMNAKSAKNPDLHRIWATSLESLLSELKAYVKNYHTQCLTWNPQKTRIMTKNLTTDAQETLDADTDYVLAFRKILKGPLAAFIAASDVLGNEIQEQAAVFAEAWEAEEVFLRKAISTPQPNDVQEMLNPIASILERVGAFAENGDPRRPFAHHCNAISESVGALGWVAVDEKAATFVSDMAGAGQFYLDKVKMDAKKSSNPEAHRTWARSLEELYSRLKAYVKEHHPQRLVWNPPKRVVTVKASAVVNTKEVISGLDYVSAFENLVAGPMTKFVTASDTLGAEVKEQALALAEAWEAERDFLSRAITMSKPDSVDDLMAPIGAKMSKVAAVVDKVGPRGAFAQHCNAVAESVGALGWVAVDEKATAYVSDMAGAGQFFIDKVKMDAKKCDNASQHREWARALEALLADLKAYVKEYHTQRLTWKAT